jgi:hypothetical protein
MARSFNLIIHSSQFNDSKIQIQKSKSHEIPLFFLYVLYIKREMRDREKERKRKMKEWKKNQKCQPHVDGHNF